MTFHTFVKLVTARATGRMIYCHQRYVCINAIKYDIIKAHLMLMCRSWAVVLSHSKKALTWGTLTPPQWAMCRLPCIQEFNIHISVTAITSTCKTYKEVVGIKLNEADAKSQLISKAQELVVGLHIGAVVNGLDQLRQVVVRVAIPCTRDRSHN
jgi:hypothetical protein